MSHMQCAFHFAWQAIRTMKMELKLLIFIVACLQNTALVSNLVLNIFHKYVYAHV